MSFAVISTGNVTSFLAWLLSLLLISVDFYSLVDLFSFFLFCDLPVAQALKTNQK